MSFIRVLSALKITLISALAGMTFLPVLDSAISSADSLSCTALAGLSEDGIFSAIADAAAPTLTAPFSFKASCYQSLGAAKVKEISDEVMSLISGCLSQVNAPLSITMITALDQVRPIVDCISLSPTSHIAPCGEANFRARAVAITVNRSCSGDSLSGILFHELLHVVGADGPGDFETHNGSMPRAKKAMNDVVYACQFICTRPDDKDVNSFSSCRTCAMANPSGLAAGKVMKHLPSLPDNVDDTSRRFCQDRNYPFNHDY